MPYNKNNWNTGDIITAFKMRKIEDQLAEVSKEIDSAINSNVEGSLGQRINDIIIMSNEEPTSQYNEIWLNTNTTQNTVQIPLMEDLHKLESSIASAGVYTIGEDYAVDDYVYYEENLYKCISAIQNAGAWNGSKWERINLLDIIEEIRLSIINNSENIPELPIFIATYGVTTTAEIYTAKSAGKQIFANKNGIYYPLVGGGNTSTGASAYALVDGSGYVINILHLANPSTWTSSSMTLAESDSPVLTNARASETPAASSNDTHLATTAFVQTAVSNATILTSQNGTKYKLKVANDGTLSTEVVT